MLTFFQVFMLVVSFSIAAGVVCLAVGFAVGRKHRPVAEMADPAYRPALDRSERVVRDALGDEADHLASEYHRRDGGR